MLEYQCEEGIGIMKLDRVQISQFRSIKDLEIRFQPTCRILVGKNESGKSNILKALSLLNDDISIDVSDLREGLPGEQIEMIFYPSKPYSLLKRIQL